MPSSTEWIPCLYDDTEVMKMFYHFRVLIIRMNLVLYQHRFDVHLRQKLVNLLDIVARYAYRADFALRYIFLHRLVRFHIICSRMVQQHKVDISDVEFAQTLLNGSFRIIILGGIEFGRHEDFLTRHTRFTDTLSHFLFIVIHVCRIELAETGGKRGFYGIDASAEMLSEAMQKSSEKGLNILYLKQKMQNLNLYGTIDTCICTLDSINHITKEEDVTKAFERVAFFMNQDGVFMFDVNTVYKHEQVLANNTFVYETDKVFCVWQNTLRENCVTDIDLDFFEEENGVYYRTSESFSERGYSREKLTEMLVNAGFELEAVYGDMSFDEPKADEQRLVFVARMKNPINKEC